MTSRVEPKKLPEKLFPVPTSLRRQPPTQQVTWRTAFVSGPAEFNSSMA